MTETDATSPDDPETSAQPTLLEGTIRRLIAAIEDETRRLQSGESFDLAPFNRLKRIGVVELGHALTMDPEPRNARELMSALRDVLDRNGAVLSCHVNAMQQISTILAGAIAQAESDGTYAPPGQPRAC